jgi:hypothetical protein
VTLSGASQKAGVVGEGRNVPPFFHVPQGRGLHLLIINNIALNGPNPNQFTQNNNCPGSLGVGASCTVNVAFRPRSRGNKSATLNVNVAAPATSQSVALTGTGI